MNFLKLLFSVVFVSGLIFLTSCDEDDSPTDNNDDTDYSVYFPSSSGDSWTYSNYALDMDNVRQEDTEYEDNTVSNGKESYNGKNADKHTTTVLTETNIHYFSFENNSYYADGDFAELELTDLISELGFKLPTQIEDEWVPIANFKDKTWQAYNKTITKFPVKIDSYDIELDGTYKINGERGSVENITVGEETVAAQKFTLTHTISLSTIIIIYPVDFTINFKVDLYFSENIGLVKKVRESNNVYIKIDVPSVDNIDRDVPGIERILTEYTVNIES